MRRYAARGARPRTRTPSIELSGAALFRKLPEGGGWKDHLHLLLQSRPTIRLCDLYGQLKGYGATMWRKRFADRPFKWGDGMFARTADPDNCGELRSYIRNQWKRHENGLLVPDFESMND